MMTQRDQNTGAVRNAEAPTLGQETPDILASHPGPLLDFEEPAARTSVVARLHFLWNQRRFLFKVTLLGFILAALVALLIPKRYSSTARLMPPEQNASAAAALLGAASGRVGTALMPLAESAFGLRTTGNLFIGILESQTVQDDLIRKFGLQKLYRTRYIEDTRKELAKHTELFQDAKSGIVTITVTDRDPQRASAMAQGYIEELNWVVNNLNTSEAHRERVFLEERLKQVKVEMETAEQQFSQFASQKGTIDIQTQGKAMVEAAAGLQGQLIAAQSELEGVRQIYTANNVRVRSLQARIAELRRQLQKIGGSGVNESSQADELYPSIRQLPLLGVSYADLLRRVKVEEAIYETLTQQYELAKVQEAKEIPTVKVLDTPMVPQKKSFPPRLVIVALGTMFAFVLGTIWILAGSAWAEVDSSDPRKIVAVQIWADMRASLPWDSQNGSAGGGQRRWIRKRLRQTQSK